VIHKIYFTLVCFLWSNLGITLLEGSSSRSCAGVLRRINADMLSQGYRPEYGKPLNPEQYVFSFYNLELKLNAIVEATFLTKNMSIHGFEHMFSCKRDGKILNFIISG
jgi:hypothetical protein